MLKAKAISTLDSPTLKGMFGNIKPRRRVVPKASVNDARTVEAIATRLHDSFETKRAAGQELFSITLHFEYIPELYKRGEWNLDRLRDRVDRFWRTMQGRMYRNTKNKDDLMVCCWDVGSGKGYGLHAHCLLSVSPDKMRNSRGVVFEEFWKTNLHKLFGHEFNGEKELIHSATLLKWNGDKKFINYCLKSIGHKNHLSVGDLVYCGKF